MSGDRVWTTHVPVLPFTVSYILLRYRTSDVEPLTSYQYAVFTPDEAILRPPKFTFALSSSFLIIPTPYCICKTRAVIPAAARPNSITDFLTP